MNLYRKTFAEINLGNLRDNVRSLVERYSSYDYYFGVVKADCYGHNGLPSVKAILDGGCNYLAVATLDEALIIREAIKDIPILCLGVVDVEYIPVCVNNNITVTVSNLEYLKSIKLKDKRLTIHVKINTGMNRLGVGSRDEFDEIIKIIKRSGFKLEGIYTHIYDTRSRECTIAQYEKFKEITSGIDLREIPIVHIGASEATEFYPKKKYANGCRLGISMYGLVEYNDIEFKPTFSLYSEVIQINHVKNGTVGYNGAYKVCGEERIAVVAIGYADGIIRKNTGREVYINNKSYKIVGNICMDMLFVKVDDSVKVGDKVVIIRDIEHIKKIAKHLDTITYEVLCTVSKRIPRVYKW